MNDNVPNILLVEDEVSLNDTIRLNLELEGMKVTSLFDGSKVLPALENKNFHLLILDIMLPNVDGLTLCNAIRQNDQNIQILMISAKDSSLDRIRGLKLGADDYLPKPFDLEELMLRIKSLLKRNQQVSSTPSIYTFGNNTIDLANYTASNENDVFNLTQREAKLLELLFEKEGEVVSREMILKEVWGYEDILPNTRTIDNFILNFRKNFETDPKNPKHFISVWGVGYRFNKD